MTNNTAPVVDVQKQKREERRAARHLRREERKVERAEAEAESADGRAADAAERRAFSQSLDYTFGRLAGSIDRVATAIEAAAVSSSTIDALQIEVRKLRETVSAGEARRAELANDPSRRFATIDDVKSLIAQHDGSGKGKKQ